MGIGQHVTMADLEADPDPILARMRAEEPVCWVPALDMWLVTRWDDVAELEADPDRFTAATSPSFLARALGPNMLVMDPPAHTRLQSILRPPFLSGGRSGDFVRDELAPLAADLAAGIVGDRFDVMDVYAQPLAAGALAVVLGLDHHGFDRMWSWCEGLCGDIANFENDPALTEIGDRTKADLGAAIAERIEHAGPEDRSAIRWFVDNGATPDEVVNNVRLMISGGINEPRDGIGLVTWILLDRPDLRARIEAEPARLRRLIEEAFRVHSPVGTVTRQATVDTELGGASIRAGQLVSGVLRSINLDESHWSNPTEIDLDRREGPHAAFALGIHRCLGEWLGRQVVKVGVEQLLRVAPDLRLDPDQPVSLTGFEFRGPHALHVVR
ncbi:MAG: cytochrome P450 [Actinomycetota bacterium]